MGIFVSALHCSRLSVLRSLDIQV